MPKKIKILIVIFSLAILSILLSGFYILNKEVLKPSYVSYTASCNPDSFETKFPDYYIVGETTYDGENITINVTETTDLELNKEILKHECIHKNQILREFLMPNCSKPIVHYLAEVEAYSFQNMPDKIFNVIYGKNC